jgi:hypothetical protein
MKPIVRKTLTVRFENSYFCDSKNRTLICKSILARRIPWVREARDIIVELYPADYPYGKTIRFKYRRDRIKYSISERSSIRGVLTFDLEHELIRRKLVSQDGTTATYKLVVA